VTPVFQAAGLDPSAIEIYIVNDPSINAFVAGGQKIFINTGLLMRSESPGQIIGVIAHETGHIAHGDLSRMQDVMSKSSAEQILAMVLGAAVGVATGRGDAGAAVAAGGARAGQENLFQYSRSQEAAADAAAMRFLDATGESAKGLLDFLKTLSDQELLSARYQDPYLRTHPLTSERIKALQEHVAESRFSGAPFPPEYKEMNDRMRAKLLAFMEPPARTLRRFPETDTSLPARYARAVAYYKIPDLDKALPAINSLIAERPADPYFLELKGQMLFENARPAEAIGPYEAAVRLLPQEPLLRLDLARIQIEMNDPALLEPAIANLRMALAKEPNSVAIWHFLAIAYGRNNDMGQSTLSMAEEAYFRGKLREAREHASRAKKLLPANSAGALQAEDIIQATKDKLGDKDNPDKEE
jgi:predicted Zn-dependent protease